MPYIDKKYYNSALVNPHDPGELAYKITHSVIQYLMQDATVNFQRLNAVVGVLDNVKAEFQRRILMPYENRKILENGDVYDELCKTVLLKTQIYIEGEDV